MNGMSTSGQTGLIVLGIVKESVKEKRG